MNSRIIKKIQIIDQEQSEPSQPFIDLLYVVVSASDISPCIKIDKPKVVNIHVDIHNTIAHLR